MAHGSCRAGFPRRWQLPSNYYYVDMPVPAGAPTIRAFFIDANPFIESCATCPRCRQCKTSRGNHADSQRASCAAPIGAYMYSRQMRPPQGS